MVPLHKKEDRDEMNNYRGVCLLTMASITQGNLVAQSLRWWSNDLSLTDAHQNRFRSGRSTADASATQIMIRLEEDMEDLRRRR